MALEDMVASTIEISGRRIGEGYPPYIIAELSANHGGDLDRALRIIDIAAESGADAIKFQTYTASSLTIDCLSPEFIVMGENPWKGRCLYELYNSASTPYAWLPALFLRAKERGITAFSSPFDAAGIEALEAENCPAYKIASFEAVDLELISAAAATGKPLIISTGMCDCDDVVRAVGAARSAGAKQIALLKCTSAYPANSASANLLAMHTLANKFSIPIGLSDHTFGTSVSVAACALGAAIIEKHVIDSRAPETADSQFSLLPSEFRALVEDCRSAWVARGRGSMEPSAAEGASVSFRRSIYVVADVGAGETLTRANVASIRPGFGMKPYMLPRVLGKRAVISLKRGTALLPDMVEDL